MFELQLAEISLGWWYLSKAIALLWPYAFIAAIFIIVITEAIKRRLLAR